MNQENPNKECVSCHKIKSISEFYKNNKKKDGTYSIYSTCKICCNQRTKQWCLNHPERSKEIKTNWRLDNPDKDKQSKKQWRIDNPEKMQQCREKWILDNPEKVKQLKLHHRIYDKEKYAENPEKYKQKKKQWRLDHIEQDKQTHKRWRLNHPNYNKQRRKNNLAFKLICNYRKRTWDIFKGYSKSQKTIDLLGCTPQEFQKEMEALCTSEMLAGGYGNKAGQWSIDHIIPCSLFNIEDPVEQKQALHHTNCRPMIHIENLKKADKIEGLNLLYRSDAQFI